MAYVGIRVVEMLDHIERRVELMREQAIAMEQERDCLIEMIEEVKKNRDLGFVSLGEKEEIEVNAERLKLRCLTVEVRVSTPRNQIQETALTRVNGRIDALVSQLKTDLSGSKTVCQSFLNSCLPEAKGPIDQRFHRLL